MDDDVTISVGVFSLGNAFGHIAIGVTDRAGRVIAEYNGLATGPDGRAKPIGYPWQFNDTIKVYSDRRGLFDRSSYSVKLGNFSSEEFTEIQSKRGSTIDVINSQNFGYRLLTQNSNSIARTLLESIGLAPPVGRLNRLAIPGYDNILVEADFLGDIRQCFPAATPIQISLTETRPIADIRVGDTVLAFDPKAELGRGALVPRKVTRANLPANDNSSNLKAADKLIRAAGGKCVGGAYLV